jgi:hypothetical protein
LAPEPQEAEGLIAEAGGRSSAAEAGNEVEQMEQDNLIRRLLILISEFSWRWTSTVLTWGRRFFFTISMTKQLTVRLQLDFRNNIGRRVLLTSNETLLLLSPIRLSRRFKLTSLTLIMLLAFTKGLLLAFNMRLLLLLLLSFSIRVRLMLFPVSSGSGWY